MDTDTLLFFSGRPEALELYEILKQQILSRVNNVRIKTAKTQITFANPKGFAFVSFLPVRRAKQRPPVYLTVTFGLDYRKESARIDAATEPYPNRWTHHVMISKPEDVDEELLSWIAEAAAFSAAK